MGYDFDPEPRIPLNWYNIVAFILLCWIMSGISKWCIELAMRLSNGFVSLGNTYIAGFRTARAASGIPVAGAIGAARGAVFGSRNAQGARTGGLVRLFEGGRIRNPISQTLRGSRLGGSRAISAQTIQTREIASKDLPSVAKLLPGGKTLQGQTLRSQTLRSHGKAGGGKTLRSQTLKGQTLGSQELKSRESFLSRFLRGGRRR